MLTLSTKRAVQDILLFFSVITNQNVYNKGQKYSYQAEVVDKSIYSDLFPFSTTESIRPNFFASSAVIKLSRSKAFEISSTDFPVCFE